MGKAEFKRQLEACGYIVREPFPDFLVIDFVVETGKATGKKLQIGFYVPAQLNFPDLPPGGPHFNPFLLPLNDTAGLGHPNGAIHPSRNHCGGIQIGAEWQYWSRPFNNWANSNRSVETYLSHVRHLLDTI